MDSSTFDLFRVLQSGPYDETGLSQIQRQLGGQRRILRGKGDSETLGELIAMLHEWATAAGGGRLSAAALACAAEVAEFDLKNATLAEELRTEAILLGRSLVPRSVQPAPEARAQAPDAPEPDRPAPSDLEPTRAPSDPTWPRAMPVQPPVQGEDTPRRPSSPTEPIQLKHAPSLMPLASAGDGEPSQDVRVSQFPPKVAEVIGYEGEGAGERTPSIAAESSYESSDTSEYAELEAAIEHAEQELEADADPANVRALADLYAQRGAPGDADQAAELYCTLGEVLGNPAGIPMLELALSQVPDHPEAKALLTRYAVRPRLATAGPKITMLGAPPPVSHNSAPPAAAHMPAPPPAAHIPAPPPAAHIPAPPPAAHIPAPPPAAHIPAPPPVARVPSHIPAPHAGVQATPPPLPSARAEPVVQSHPGETSPAQAFSAEASELRAEPRVESAGHAAYADGEPRDVLSLDGVPQVVSARPSEPVVTTLTPVVCKNASGKGKGKGKHASAARKRVMLSGGIALSAAAAFGLFVATQSGGSSEPQALAHETATPAAVPPMAASAIVETVKPEPMAQPSEGKAQGAIPGSAEASDSEAAEPSEQEEPSEQAEAQAGHEPDAKAPAAPRPQPAPAAVEHVASLKLDTPKLRGGKLDQKRLSAALSRAETKLLSCYEHVLEKKPRIRGRVVYGFTVRRNGRAAKAKRIGGTLRDAALIQCSVKAIESSRFPKPRRRDAQVKLPIQYKRS